MMHNDMREFYCRNCPVPLIMIIFLLYSLTSVSLHVTALFSCSMLVLWKAASLTANTTPPRDPSPPLPSLLCFLPQESTYPTAWHWTLQGRAGKEQLQALALQSSVSACTLFSSVHCLMSHASHVRCWARLVRQAVDPCAVHTGDPTF